MANYDIIKYILNGLNNHPSYGIVFDDLCGVYDKLQFVSENSKTFSFLLELKNNIKINFELRMIKGSMKTTFWNKYARIDEELILSMKLPYSETEQSESILWHLRGMDGVNSKLSTYSINWVIWFEMKRLLENLRIGITTFAKYFSILLCTLPLYHTNKVLIRPMPISFMVNYLFNVASSPCLQLLLKSCLLEKTSFIKGLNREYYNIITSKLLQQDGASFFLSSAKILSRFNFFNFENLSIVICLDLNLGDSTRCLTKRPTAQSSSIRVVEIREHPIGVDGVICLLEEINLIQNCITQRVILKNTRLLFEYLNHHSNLRDEGLKYLTVDSKFTNDLLCIKVYTKEDWDSEISNWMEMTDSKIFNGNTSFQSFNETDSNLEDTSIKCPQLNIITNSEDSTNNKKYFTKSIDIKRTLLTLNDIEFSVPSSPLWGSDTIYDEVYTWNKDVNNHSNMDCNSNSTDYSWLSNLLQENSSKTYFNFDKSDDSESSESLQDINRKYTGFNDSPPKKELKKIHV